MHNFEAEASSPQNENGIALSFVITRHILRMLEENAISLYNFSTSSSIFLSLDIFKVNLQ